MRQRIIFYLIAVIAFAAASPPCLACSSKDEDQTCHIEGTPIEATIVFPAEAIIHLNNWTVDYFSPELAANIQAATRELSILDGFVPKVFVKPTLRTITILRADTADVVITAEDNFNLEVLDVEGSLKTVPDNVGHLKKLAVLDLCQNAIQQVDLNQLGGLDSLRKVNLAHNNIHSASLTEEVSLPSLKELFLHGNDLTTLDLSLLKADRLERLYLSQNHLVRIGGFPAANFGSLKRVDLYRNKWNCEWLGAALDVLNGKGVETLSYLPVTVCDETGSVSIDAIECEGSE